MNVYVLMVHDYEDDNILAVFRRKEDADRAKDYIESQKCVSMNDRWYYVDDYDFGVHEFELINNVENIEEIVNAVQDA